MKPNIITFGVAMDAYARGSQWKEALGLLKEMRTVEGIEPSQVVYGAALTACRNAGHWKEAQLLLEEMKSHGDSARLIPNRRCYNIVIDACGRAGKIEYMWI